MESKKIFEVEQSVQNALAALPSIVHSKPITPQIQLLAEVAKILAPAGYHPIVELQENGRRKRRTASADNWTPESGEILISFGKDSSLTHPSAADELSQLPSFRSRTGHVPFESSGTTVRAHTSTAPTAPNSIESQERELCRALEEVERQGRAFIALRWFRENVLPATGFSWASDPDQRQAVLTSAIAKGLIITNRVPNPRSAFPTTAIRLKKDFMKSQGEEPRYSPVRIQGDPLSSTILRDRGTY